LLDSPFHDQPSVEPPFQLQPSVDESASPTPGNASASALTAELQKTRYDLFNERPFGVSGPHRNSPLDC
jgi:hypothetical protein